MNYSLHWITGTQDGGTPQIRSSSHGWLTRASRALDEVTQKQEVTVVELKHAIDEISSRLQNVDDIQSQTEVDTDESTLKEAIDEAFRYRQRQLEIKIKADISLQQLVDTKEDRGSDTINTHNASNHRPNFLCNARLPKLELPNFGGDYLEFRVFV
ncbi:hypothetical protein PoB_006953000 [Plakobranchus ocellatus]|uniref:Uncharacterized protein n=1 Tax=Plakobranchus ocellatus TaxID=259542 RepID=A0AAV4DGB5_9GAST|nr:hypothetical protein PoB_006953000 [Plakobranchus ocellatus]